MASPPNKFVTQMVAPPNKSIKCCHYHDNKSFKRGDSIWETIRFGGDAKKVINLFDGDTVLETSSMRKPKFGANLKGQSGFKKNFNDQSVFRRRNKYGYFQHRRSDC